jgi:hypothetical protein
MLATPSAATSTQAQAQAQHSAGHDGASFLRAVRSGLEAWVRAALDRAAEDLASSAQRLAVAGGREHTSPVLGVLRKDREDLVQRMTQALRARVGHASGTPEAGAAAAAPGGLTLSLIGEAQIDEEIETARIVQLIESEADAELQELNALCSSLRRLGHVDPKAAPLRPLVCAQALREALADLPVEAGTRLLLLRALGSAVGLQMRSVYRQQADLLSSWGVKPASFRIKQTPAAARVPMDATRPGELSAPDEPAVAAQSMERLVRWARDTSPMAGDASAPATESGGLSLRLLNEPAPAGRHSSALQRPAAEQLMQRLFNQLGAQGDVSPTARQLVQGLEWAGRQLVKEDPALWSKPEHPWWTLIDRLLAVGAVHEDLGEQDQGALQASLNQVVSRIQQAPQLDIQACQQAADEVQAVASRLLEGDASALLDQVTDMQRHADREETETELRNQLVQQLRATPVCSELRRFLVGPWTQVMAVVALHHGQDSGELAAAALVVDDLIRATAKPGQRVSSAQRAVLLRQVNEGLDYAGLPATRVQAEVVDLKAVLRDPPAPQEQHDEWTEVIEPVPAGQVLDLHAGLPTVPLAMGADAHATDPGDWVASLDAGAYCRLFLQGRWLTAQLRWVSPSRNLFLFNSRHGGRAHSLTRRMLQKLRNAGLATNIQDGFLLAQAMDTLSASTLD